MNSQLTIKWRVSKHLNAGEFRKRLGAITEVELPNLLFWHDSSGQTVRCGHTNPNTDDAAKRVRVPQPNRVYGPKCEEDLKNDLRIEDDSMAMIRFFHTKSYVGIHFLGLDMIRFASEHVPLILEAASLALGPCRFEVHETEIDLKSRLTPSVWFIPSLTLKRPTFDFLSEEQYCERIIRQDILRQARILGISVPSGFFIKVTHIEHKGRYWVRAGSGPKTGGHLRMENVQFVTNLDFKGQWSCGSLTSKGFGPILRSLTESKNVGEAA